MKKKIKTDVVLATLTLLTGLFIGALIYCNTRPTEPYVRLTDRPPATVIYDTNVEPTTAEDEIQENPQ